MKIFWKKSLATVIILCALVAMPCHDALGFDFQSAIQIAKQRAAKPYKAPKSAPKFLTDLTYDQYRQIRFKSKDRIWRKKKSNFQIAMMAPGLNYKHIVNIYLVDNPDVHKATFNKSAFIWPSEKVSKQVPKNLGFAGFKITYPLNAPDEHDEVLVFAGMSYFRGVGRNQGFGLSGRGIAIDTGLSIGEKFPSFTDFWLRYPGPDAKKMQFYALLDGKRLTGAYQFTVIPGASTKVKVKAVLFMRENIKLLGLAPITSMFYYGRNTPRPAKRWRGAIHDSDGLLMHLKTGEWLWHPLINPIGLEMEYFQAGSPKGFGLMQRERNFHTYNDAEARYDIRPSAWVVPHNDWGKGHVVLVKIPTNSEYNDNIVAFWAPDKTIKSGDQRTLSYTLKFGNSQIAQEPLASAVHTYVGSPSANQYRFVIDFEGGALSKLSKEDKVKGVISALNGGKILSHHVQWVAPISKWRLSFLVESDGKKKLNLRGYLKSHKKTLTETWTYTLPVKNRINSHE